MRFLKRVGKNSSGATAIEYALLAALIALVVIIGVTAIGDTLSNTFNDLANAI